MPIASASAGAVIVVVVIPFPFDHAWPHPTAGCEVQPQVCGGQERAPRRGALLRRVHSAALPQDVRARGGHVRVDREHRQRRRRGRRRLLLVLVLLLLLEVVASEDLGRLVAHLLEQGR